MYVEQHIVDPDGRLRIALVWIPDIVQDDNLEKQPEERVVIIDLDIDDLDNIINFDLN